ncbi:hypothetical protein [Neisseria sp. Ec49-e6-T10]|uniref:hypothetical protein n=1 Tax=Neisseria sp. Ec49-e6-T10 TaxID=3140744 RepID=UPI003EBBD58E
MQKIPFILFVMLPVLGFAQQNVYRYQDQNKHPVYTDIQPNTNIPTTTLKFADSPTQKDHSAIEQGNTTLTDQTKNKSIDYRLTINGVSNGAAIRSNDGHLSISLSASEAIPDSAQYQLLLDGAVYGSAQSSSSFALVNIDRGEHTVVGQIVENGQVIASSSPVTFVLQRISVNSPARIRPTPY